MGVLVCVRSVLLMFWWFEGDGALVIGVLESGCLCVWSEPPPKQTRTHARTDDGEEDERCPSHAPVQHTNTQTITQTTHTEQQKRARIHIRTDDGEKDAGEGASGAEHAH